MIIINIILVEFFLIKIPKVASNLSYGIVIAHQCISYIFLGRSHCQNCIEFGHKFLLQCVYTFKEFFDCVWLFVDSDINLIKLPLNILEHFLRIFLFEAVLDVDVSSYPFYLFYFALFLINRSLIFLYIILTGF